MIKASGIITLIRVNDGTNGKDAAVQSAISPSDKTYMWLDISVEPPLLKRYDGSKWVVVNDTTGSIAILNQNISASTQNMGNSLMQTVSENYSLKDDLEAVVSSVTTQVEQTNKAFNFTFNEFSKNLNDVINGTDAKFQDISKYIRFVDGNIVLGVVGNELTLKLQNDRISFLQGNSEVAYFTNRKLYVTDGEYTNSLKLGKFAFIPRSNGNLSFKKIED